MRVAIALRGCAQKDLAAAMGITPASLSQKFVGKTLWNLVDIEKASGFFNVKPEAFVAGHGFEPWTSESTLSNKLTGKIRFNDAEIFSLSHWLGVPSDALLGLKPLEVA